MNKLSIYGKRIPSLATLLSLILYFLLTSLGFGQTIDLKTSNTLIVDSNKACPPDSEGPHATYVSYEICNTTGAVIQDYTATLNLVGTGYSLGGGQQASQSIGQICASYLLSSLTPIYRMTYLKKDRIHVLFAMKMKHDSYSEHRHLLIPL